MFTLGSGLQYFLCPVYTDMRNSFDGLCGIVTSKLGRNPLSGDVFIFINKRRNCMKLLHWEEGGFVLYYKRLETGTFELPQIRPEMKTFEISWPYLVMMNQGISLRNIQQRKRYKMQKAVL